MKIYLVLADLQSASIEYKHLKCDITRVMGLLSLRRRRSYGSPHQAAMTSSHCSKDLIRPISNTVGL